MQRHSRSSRQEFWRQVLRRQHRSGLSIHRFCAQEGLAAATFYVWQRRLRTVAGGGSPAVHFAPVRVVEEGPHASSAGTLEIVLPQDRRVRITGVVDRQQLADVLAVLGT